MQIGILGGTFDPVHVGHLAMAEWAREAAGLDEVWFMPAAIPPHKAAGVARAAERLAMVELAIADNPHFRVCTLELEREGVSYSIDTVEALAALYPEYRFHWLIGADMVDYLPKWRRIAELVERIGFIGFARPGFAAAYAELPTWLQAKVRMVDVPQLDISSTALRNRIAAGQTVKYAVTAEVESYMIENRLYIR